MGGWVLPGKMGWGCFSISCENSLGSAADLTNQHDIETSCLMVISYQMLTTFGIITAHQALQSNLHLRGGRIGTPYKGLSHEPI